MTQFSPKMAKHNFRLRFWNRLLMCSSRKPIRYCMLSRAASPAVPSASFDDSFAPSRNLTPPPVCHRSLHDRKDSGLVPLKISLLGDPQIGKTSFLAKYIGDEKNEHEEDTQAKGLNLMDKTFVVEGARIYYSIWEVDGAEKSQDHIPLACQDSVAILFMFDLTSRCTLNNVISWYQEARKWNQFDYADSNNDFDRNQLPIDLQWTIASQARAYAKVLNATVFFSSATYNINVNKIFKFITAKLFDLPWTVQRNLTIGEPIIDF